MKEQANILVIEDDKEFRETLIKALKKEGYFVCGARKGEDALNLAKQNNFDLIISDVRLPGGKDGLEVTKEIKKIYADQIPAVIMITGYASEDVPIKAIKEKVDDYFTKPFNLNDFLKIVSGKIENIHRFKKNRGSIEGKIKEIISKTFNYEIKNITPKTSFLDDIKTNIYKNVQLIIDIEEALNVQIEDAEAEKFQTVQDLYDYIFKII